jgi:hypothetical protein
VTLPDPKGHALRQVTSYGSDLSGTQSPHGDLELQQGSASSRRSATCRGLAEHLPAVGAGALLEVVLNIGDSSSDLISDDVRRAR